MFDTFPKVYPILDSSVIPGVGREAFLQRLGKALADAGVRLLEYRNKGGEDEELLADARILRGAMPAGQVKLILDDRADLVGAVEFDGVHVDAGDVSPTEARRLVGAGRIVGTFGGSNTLLHGILKEPVDYLAVGARLCHDHQTDDQGADLAGRGEEASRGSRAGCCAGGRRRHHADDCGDGVGSRGKYGGGVSGDLSN